MQFEPSIHLTFGSL